MFGFKKKEERTVSPTGWLEIFDAWYSKPNSDAISTSYACIKVISQSIASTTLQHTEYDKESGFTVLDTTNLSRLLKKPYQYDSQFTFQYNMVSDLISTGNAYALIIRDSNNVVQELRYIPEHNVSIYVTIDDKNPYYYQVTYFGQSLKIFPEDIIHYRINTIDGITGLNPIEYHRFTMDTAQSMQEFQKYFLDNTANISAVIESEKKLSADTVEQLRSNFKDKFSGKKNSGSVPVLPDGLHLKQLKPISPLDADFINQKKLLKQDIAEIYGVPLSLLGQTDATYANAEALGLTFAKYTLGPIKTMIEQELSLKLIPSYKPKEKILFKRDEMHLSPAKEKAETLSLLYNTGVFTANECREYYNKSYVENGDVLKTDNESNQAAPKDANLIGQGNNASPADPMTDSRIAKTDQSKSVTA